MKTKDVHVETVKMDEKSKIKSPLDLWRAAGGRSKHPHITEKPADSMLVVYENRVTYTFIIDNEVASIHFDRERGEIFFKGHNIRHLNLTKHQIEALKGMKEVLLGDARGKTLFSNYSATLDRYLADNNIEAGAPFARPKPK